MAETQPWWLQDLCYTAAEFRQHTASFVDVEGVADVLGGDLKVTSTAAGDNSVNTAEGQAFVQGDSAGVPDTTKGMYRIRNDNAGRVNQLTANPSADPRIDTVIATVRDNEYGGGFDDWIINIVDGAPTAGAQITSPLAAGYRAGAGAVPDNSIVLAYIRNVAGSTLATTIAAVDIEDARKPFVQNGDSSVLTTLWRRSTNQSINNAVETLLSYPVGPSGTAVPNPFYRESGGVVTFDEAGVYLVIAEVQWATNATGYRKTRLYAASGLLLAQESVPAVSATAQLITRMPAVVVAGVGTQVETWVEQSSGFALDALGSLRVTRLGQLAA